MTDPEKDAVAHVLNRLPFVQWDRLVQASDAFMGTMHVVAYGWIPRNGARSDFVTVQIDGVAEHVSVNFTTSSAAYSREIMRRLLGTDEGHLDCERVEDVLGVARVPTAIELAR